MLDNVPTIPPKVPRLENEHRKVVSVILDNNSPVVRKNLHCPNCGRIVLNYYTESRLIIFGEVSDAERPMDVQCSRCKTLVRVI